MIKTALDTLQKELDAYIKAQFGTGTENAVVAAPVLQFDGTPSAKNCLVLSLVNIAEERTFKAQTAAAIAADRLTVGYVNPEIKLNLYILISSTHVSPENYLTGLRHLSGVFSFFQGKSVFDRDNTPGLPPSIEKLVVELHTLSFEEMNHLWAALGAKYLPSALYRVRMLVVQEGRRLGEQGTISTINFDLRRT